MNPVVRLLAIALAGFSLTGLVSAEPLIFSATGCGPYKPAEEPLLEEYVKLVNADGRSEFLVHLGDVVSGSKKQWPESQYQKVAGILRQSKVPAFVVLGDNEWNDLDNPAEGLGFWNKHFKHLEKNWQNRPEVAYQDVRPENFAFVSKGVLVLGINLVGGRVHDAKEWKARLADNLAWIGKNLKDHKTSVRAAVILAQANPSMSNKAFFKDVAGNVKAFEKPVLYLHADGHVWQHEPAWLAKNLLRVQTDQVSKAPPVLVTVTDAGDFQFDRRLPK